jgi:hypothetical protein
MAKYAVIEKNIVVNCILADDQATANLFGQTVEYTDANPAYIGGTYDGTKFIAPVVKTPIIPEVIPNPNA